jgi:DNA mismatch repair protein MutL
MSRIRILDAAVIDRIAAGEVVERPASVIKEVVENALDAQSSRLDIRVEGGGTQLIEVVDNGHGMDAEDAVLAFSQHATSKVSVVEDLDAIDTLGFRGEALASIASVSRVDLSTGTGEGAGVRVRVEGGEIVSTESIAWPRGTTLRVADLFFNTPARLKHLRTEATELGHIARAVQDYALAMMEVHFTLRHGKRSVLSAPPVATLRERIHQVLGADVASAWLPVEYASGGIRISGGVTTPDHARPNRQAIRWYVNDRPISDYRLTHALMGAYENLLDGGKFPVAVLFLEMSPAEVDVNVHPRKAEVRFTHAGRIYGAVRSAVHSTLATHLPPTRIQARAATSGFGPGGGSPWAGEGETGAVTNPYGSGEPRHAALPISDWFVAEGRVAADAGGTVPSQHDDTAAMDAMLEAGRSGISGTAGVIQPLAQYANTYILAADDQGLLIIDQHVAHERILYEQVLQQMSQRGVEAQHLLVPETLELDAAEAESLREHGELLGNLGFEVDAFGGASWAIRTAPAMLGGRRLTDALRSLLASLGAGGGAEALEEVRRSAAATIACHAAVRANHPLTREEMVRLVADLSRCDAPTRCPHGRPVLLRVDHYELEKRLGRR